MGFLKSLWERVSQRERIAVLSASGVLALLFLLFVLDVVGGLVFFLMFVAILAGIGLLFYRVYQRDEVPLPRTSRAPTESAPLGKRILRYAGYTAFWFFCFVIFAYWTFPYDRVKDFIIQEVERPMGPGERRIPSGVQLSIDELSPSFITGVDLEGVTYTQLPEEPDGEPTEVEIEEATVRVSLLSLLTGGLGVSYDLSIGGGNIEGEFEQSDTSQHVVAQMSEVDLSKLGVIRGLIGLPVTGKLEGNVDITVAEEAEQTAGSLAVTIEDLQIGDGEAKFPVGGMSEGLTIERIEAGNLTLELEVEEGVAELKEFSSDGPDLALAASGNIRLAQPFERSRMDLLLRVAFTDRYKEKSDLTTRLFAALELAPQVRPARTDDGALQYRVTGAFGGRGPATRPAGREPPPGR
jgi:type II secretion system protein N